MYFKKITISDALKKRPNYGKTPVNIKSITAEYSLKELIPTRWAIEFSYLEDRRPCPGYECALNDIIQTDTIVVENVNDVNEAINIAFSDKYWYECEPMVLKQPANPYFDIERKNGHGFIVSKHGWKSMLLPYIDVEFALHRNDVVKEATNYAKKNNIEFVYIRSNHNANPFTILMVRRLKLAGMKVVMVPDLTEPDEELMKLLDYRADNLLDAAEFITKGDRHYEDM